MITGLRLKILNTLKFLAVCFLPLALCLLPARGWAGENRSPAKPAPSSLDSSTAIRWFLGRSPQIKAIRTSVAIAETRRAEASIRPNPELAYDIESLPGTPGALAARQETIKLVHPILWPGKIDARRAEANREVASAKADVLAREFELVIDFQRLFFETLTHQYGVKARQEGLNRLEEVLTKLRARHDEGLASSYDLSRLEAERGQIDAGLGLARIALEKNRFLLKGRLGLKSSATLPPLSGDLEPRAAEEPEPGDVQKHPRVRILDRRIELAQSSLNRAERDGKPDLSLFGGKLDFEQGPTQNGFVAGIVVELPIHDQNQGEKASARAQQASLEMQRKALLKELETDLEAAKAAYEQRRDQLEAQRRTFLKRPAALLVTITASFTEGSHGLLELLDAYRLSRQSRLSYIDHASAVRKAWLDLQAATGHLPDVATTRSLSQGDPK